MKKFFLVLLVIIVIAVGVLYYFRFDIFQYSAESIIKDNLPPFVVVDRIIFDLKAGMMKITKLQIKNPPSFHNKYLSTIKTITCQYKMQGKNILDGIEVTDITVKDIDVDLERLASGDINVTKMDQVMQQPAASTRVQKTKKGSVNPPVDISKLIKLPDVIHIKNGNVVFTDNFMPAYRPYRLTFEGITGTLSFNLSDDFKTVNSMSTVGQGFVEGDARQSISWNILLRPQDPQLNMNNNIDLSGVNIMPFKPYFDEYAPVDVQSAIVSGKLTIDFEGGNIGSTNTLYVNNLRFVERQGGFASNYWDVGIADIVKYLKSSSGEIIFDFKIKGPVNSPQFFPGPHLKQALQSMVVDKVSSVIQSLSGETKEGAAAGGASEGGSDVDQAVNMIKGLFNK